MLLSGPLHKLINGLDWHRRKACDWVKVWLLRLGPRVYIACNWPLVKKPWQRARLRLSAPGGGIGDELMCTAIFAAIKARNPECHITFITRYADYFAAHPLVDAIEVESQPKQSDVIQLAYHYVIPPPRPLMTLMGECVGLRVREERIIAPPVSVPAAISAKLDAIPGPHVVIQPLSSRWTTNKNWPATYWRELIDKLAENYSVIEVGTESLFPKDPPSKGFWSLAGPTTVSELAYIISRADLFIGPSSGGMHLANAYKVPSTIIFGGYESPEGYRYPHTRNFYSNVPCAPCWKQTCPYELKCLKMISPGSVYKAACELLAGAAPGPRAPSAMGGGARSATRSLIL